MEKEIVSRDQLLKILNERLSEHSGYGECHYEDVTKLDAPDESGCNWKDVILKCKGMHTSTLQPFAFEMIEELKKKYNLA